MKDIKVFRFTFLLLYFILSSNILLADVLDKKYNKACILVDENQYREAILLFKQILKEKFDLDRHKKSRILNNTGYCYHKLNDFENALTFYNMALEIDNDYVVCLNNHSATLMNQKKHKEGLPNLIHAYRLDQRNIKVIFNLFVVYVNLKNKELAKYYLKKAFETDKDYTKKRLKKNNIKDKQIIKIQKYLDNH